MLLRLYGSEITSVCHVSHNQGGLCLLPEEVNYPLSSSCNRNSLLPKQRRTGML